MNEAYCARLYEELVEVHRQSVWYLSKIRATSPMRKITIMNELKIENQWI